MLLLAWFEPDAASRNIRDRLLERASWSDEGDGILRNGDLLLKGYGTEHLFTENLGRGPGLDGRGLDGVVVLSRHRAESGKRALTVHATGNFAKAEHGGIDATLSTSFPRLSGGLLRALRANAASLDCEVSLEVTHHGPFSEKPLLFVEIGSSEAEWGVAEYADAIARSLLAPDLGEAPIAIGFGGGHYAPRFSDLSSSGACDFGHIAPNYHLHSVDGAMVSQMKARTPGCQRFALHLKDEAARTRIAALCEAEGLVPL